MIELITPMLGNEDDPELWQIAVRHILGELTPEPGMLVEFGRCSHWLRPHQTRWTADGGFAWPSGYGGHGYSRNGFPLFDWSVTAEWTGEQWEPVSGRDKKGRRRTTTLRVAIPSRTTRHAQAAVHSYWRSGRRGERRFYGFRKNDGAWKCTAESDWELNLLLRG